MAAASRMIAVSSSRRIAAPGFGLKPGIPGESGSDCCPGDFVGAVGAVVPEEVIPTLSSLFGN